MILLCVLWSIIEMVLQVSFFPPPTLCLWDLCIDTNLTFILHATEHPIGFPGGASGKKKKTKNKNLSPSVGDARDAGLILGSVRSPWEGHGNPLYYSCLENPMDRGAWQFIGSQRAGHNWSDLACTYDYITIWVSLVAQLVKNLSAMWEIWVPSLGWEYPPEKGTATHSSILA